jgi:formylmethanofuran:tetrahydromethanopterin formyltransferase
VWITGSAGPGDREACLFASEKIVEALDDLETVFDHVRGALLATADYAGDDPNFYAATTMCPGYEVRLHRFT